jgi:ABC-type xylose transport system permease subunit
MDAMSQPRRTALQRILGLRDFGVLVAALLIALFFSIATPVFLTSYNLFNLLRQTSQLGIISMAMTLLIVSGEFDLSVGAIYAVTGVVTGILVNKLGLSIWVSA